MYTIILLPFQVSTYWEELLLCLKRPAWCSSFLPRTKTCCLHPDLLPQYRPPLRQSLPATEAGISKNYGVTTSTVACIQASSHNIGLLTPNLYLQSRGWNFKENSCATNSGSTEVQLRFCPWLLLFKYWTGCMAWPELFSKSLLCACIEGRGLRSAFGGRTSG